MTVVAEVNVEDTRLSYISNPIDNLHLQNLEKSLNELFLKELNSDDSIFICVRSEVVKKIAAFLSGKALRPAAIGVCGETASGKSTIVMDSISVVENFCQEFLFENTITRINTDDYYHDRSKEIKNAGSFSEFAKKYDFDVPEAIELNLMKEHIQMLLNRQEVYLPKYDMSGTGKRFNNHTLARPSSIIVAEGIYTLIDDIADIFDFKIYVEIDKSVQKRRFFERAEQRGLGASADKIFKNATKKAKIYVHPCAEDADIILDGMTSRAKYKKFVRSMLAILESAYAEQRHAEQYHAELVNKDNMRVTSPMTPSSTKVTSQHRIKGWLRDLVELCRQSLTTSRKI